MRRRIPRPLVTSIHEVILPSTKVDPSSSPYQFSFESQMNSLDDTREAIVDIEFATIIMLAGYQVTANTATGHLSENALLTFQAIDPNTTPDIFAIAEQDPGAGSCRTLHLVINNQALPQTIHASMFGHHLTNIIDLPAPLKPYLEGWNVIDVAENEGRLVFICQDAEHPTTQQIIRLRLGA